MPNHEFKKEDITVNKAFITKFANMYLQQRSEVKFDYADLDQNLLFENNGFDSNLLREIILKNSVAEDLTREAGQHHESVLTDIYRSDLGELLMTYYFEEKFDMANSFRIPLKNISNRELAGQPGRGLDAVGYRLFNNRIQLLLGEAKVSHQKTNPPGVVHSSNDSIYKTQIKFKNNKDLLINRLTDYTRKLSAKDASVVGTVILYMSLGRHTDYDLIFGCSLIRDFECVRINEDFGKFYTQQTDFDPHQVSFCILNFSTSIAETIDLFYNEVQALRA